MSKVTVILAGDFQQTLPIIWRGIAPNQINACLKNSYLSKHTEIIRKINMRVFLTGDPTFTSFSEQLLFLGDGKCTLNKNGNITFPLNLLK